MISLKTTAQRLHHEELHPNINCVYVLLSRVHRRSAKSVNHNASNVKFTDNICYLLSLFELSTTSTYVNHQNNVVNSYLEFQSRQSIILRSNITVSNKCKLH